MKLCFVLFYALLAIGCGKEKKSAKTFVKECALPSEQANAFQGSWVSTPVKISFRTGHWSDGEIAAITAAAESWNEFFKASKGFSIFDTGEGSNRSTANLTAPNCASTDGVVIYKRQTGGSWPTELGATAAAATAVVSCGAGNASHGFPILKAGIIEFNYVNYFRAGTTALLDLQTIALHELGHLLGLDHSCGPIKNGRANVACPQYLNAVMYPSVFFDSSTRVGQVKRSLDSNDQGRANCIY